MIAAGRLSGFWIALSLVLFPVLGGTAAGLTADFSNSTAESKGVRGVPIGASDMACQFTIRAYNTSSLGAWVLLGGSAVKFSIRFQAGWRPLDIRARFLYPGESVDLRYEDRGRCNARRSWAFMVSLVSLDGSGGPIQEYEIRRETGGGGNDDRTINLGEAGCWYDEYLNSEAGGLDGSRVYPWTEELRGCGDRSNLAPNSGDGASPDGNGTESDGAADRPPAAIPDVASLDGNWVRVESNNPRNNGMRIRVEDGRAMITAMPPRGSSRFSVGQVVWDDLSGDGSLGVRGSDGASYPSQLTMEGTNRLQLDIDLENSPGNDQTWERAGPSIDGDWVLVAADEKANEGLRVRVEADRATLRYVPPTAGRGFRVGGILWKEIGAGAQSNLGSLEALSNGRSYTPAQFRLLAGDRVRLVNDVDGTVEIWARPGVAEELMADANDEVEDYPPASGDDTPAEGESTATVKGTVSDAAGTPLPQVSVLATVNMATGDRRISSAYGAVTGADGAYSLELEITEPETEPEGVVAVVFEQLDEDGMATGDRQFSAPQTLRPGQTLTLNQTLGGTARGDTPAEDETTADPDESQITAVTGLVFHDVDGDGVRDADEPGIAGVTLDAVHEETGERTTVTTDAGGHYRFEAPGTMKHRLSVDASTLPFTGAPTTSPAEYLLEVPAGYTAPDVIFGYGEKHTAVVTGLVFHDVDGDGVRDADEPGIPGLMIAVLDGATGEQLHGPDGAMLLVETDAEGRYRYGATDAIDLRFRPLSALSDGAYLQSTPTEHHLEVPVGSMVVDADFALEVEPAEVGEEPEAPEDAARTGRLVEVVKRLLEDPYFDALVAGLSKESRFLIEAVLTDCDDALSAGDVQALEACMSKARTEVATVSLPNDRALAASLDLFFAHVERLLAF